MTCCTRDKRCDTHLAEHSEYQRRRRRLMAYGRWQPFVDAEPVREHLRLLLSEGMGARTIAAACGMGHAQVGFVLYGRQGRPAPAQVRAETAERLLSVPYVPTFLDPLGARRRLQALCALGYPQNWLADKLGTNQGYVWTLITGRSTRITRRVHERIDALYRAYEMRPAPQGRSATLARRSAERHGWVVPLAWSDIDDPDETPQVDTERVTKQDKLRDLIDMGVSDRNELARRVGSSVKDVETYLRRRGVAA